MSRTSVTPAKKIAKPRQSRDAQDSGPDAPKPPKPAKALVPSETSKPYWLYLLECVGDKFYCGIALDAEARFQKHCEGKGAAYTRANKPLRILAKKSFASKGLALSAEHAVKQLPKAQKTAFFKA